MRITHSFILLGVLATAELRAQRVTAPTGGKTPAPAATGAPVVGLAAWGGPSTATLSWQAPAGVTGFDVHRALAPNGSWVKLTAAPISDTRFTDVSGFSYNQAYIYRVVSLYANGSYGSVDLPFMPLPPQNPAWVQATQQGSSVVLSWAFVGGATRYIVAGATAAEGRDIAAPATSVTYENVAGGSYSWRVGARFEPGPMETPASLWPVAKLTVVATSARYRVLITGLSVLQKTSDDPLHYDGIDDEVFVAAQAIVLDRPSGAMVGKYVSKSMSYGDINNPPRVQAGSASSRGGLLSGDKLPAGDPTQPLGAPSPVALPLVVFDGTLTDGKDDVLIFPSVWEVDHGNGSVYSDWLSKVPHMRPGPTAAPNAMTGSPFPVFLATPTLLFSAKTGLPFQDQIRQDRPIGSLVWRQVDDLHTYQFQPRVFLLQREELERRLATPFIANSGAKGLPLSIQLKEAGTPYLSGDYILHVWIERVP